jgi:TetR/AcrR family transcriptional repressor of nem operon
VPRASKLQTQQHRNAITEAAARLMRERGIAAVSVSDLMGAAGLTHGGFYGHFASKRDLAAEACSQAFIESVGRWQGRAASQPDRLSALRALIESFLSTRSRDEAGSSCPTAALAGDVAREPLDSPVRRAFRVGTEHLIEVLTALQAGGDATADRREAMAQFSTLVGALVLARATAGSETADEFLRAAREQLTQRIAAAAAARPREA